MPSFFKKVIQHLNNDFTKASVMYHLFSITEISIKDLLCAVWFFFFFSTFNFFFSIVMYYISLPFNVKDYEKMTH